MSTVIAESRLSGITRRTNARVLGEPSMDDDDAGYHGPTVRKTGAARI